MIISIIITITITNNAFVSDRNQYQNTNQNDEEEEEEEEDQRIMEILLPRYPPSHHRDEITYSAKLPDFLRLEPHAFEPKQFLKQAEARFAADQRETAGNPAAAAEKSLVYKAENAAFVRWKFARDAKTGKMIKQSNARFIRWSDGSLSLQLGSEMFEIQTKDIADTFLTVSHPEQEVLQTTSMLDKTMRFIPYSTSSSTHIRLTEHLRKEEEKKSATVGNIATTDDPEKLKLAALRTEEMNLKARRKLEAKRRAMEAKEMYGESSRRGGGSAGSGGGYNDSGSAGSAAYSSRYDQYEEDDDGFIVHDEEDEEEEGAGRLKDLKRRGAEQYKKKKRDYSEDEEDADFDDEEEEDEAQFTGDEQDEESASKSKSKKRRIIDDDEEDED